MAIPHKHPQVPDYLAFALIAVIGGALLINPLHAVISDFWYHVAVAKNILETGNVSLWDTWSFQPMGRPHFYPPVIHVLLALISRLANVSLFDAGYYLGSSIYTVSLLIAWWAYRRLWGSWVALLTVAALSTSLIYTLSATSAMPASLIAMLLPVFAVALSEKRAAAALCIIVLGFYTHLLMPWLLLLTIALLIWQKFLPKRWWVSVVVPSIALALPWLIVIIRSLGAIEGPIFASGPLSGIGPLHIFSHYVLGVPLMLLVVWGLLQTRHEKSASLHVIRTILAAFIPMLLWYGGRYFWHLMPLLVLFAIVPFKAQIISFFERVSWKQIFVLLMISLFLVVPTFSVTLNAKTGETITIDPEWTALDLGMIDTENLTDTEEFRQLVKFVESHEAPQTILRTDDAELSDILYTATGIPSSNGQFWETAPTQEMVFQSGDIVVYQHSPLPDGIDIVQTIGEYTVGVVTSN